MAWTPVVADYAADAVEESLRISGDGLRAAYVTWGDQRTAVVLVRSGASWALEDTTSFCKLIADRATRKLVGAHIIGPQSSTLIQQLIQGMATGQTDDEMARGQYYIHPALPELIENALLGLEF